MSQSNQESKILRRRSIEGAVIAVDASLKLPILVRIGPRPMKPAAYVPHLEVSILDALRSVVGVKQIRPGDVHEHYEDLSFEGDVRVVEDLNGRQGCFPRLAQKLLFDREQPPPALRHVQFLLPVGIGEGFQLAMFCLLGFDFGASRDFTRHLPIDRRRHSHEDLTRRERHSRNAYS